VDFSLSFDVGSHFINDIKAYFLLCGVVCENTHLIFLYNGFSSNIDSVARFMDYSIEK
jgi:hypothetical protein